MRVLCILVLMAITALPVQADLVNEKTTSLSTIDFDGDGVTTSRTFAAGFALCLIVLRAPTALATKDDRGARLQELYGRVESQQDLAQAVRDLREMAPYYRGVLPNQDDSTHAVMIRHYIVVGLVGLKAPAPELVAALDSAEASVTQGSVDIGRRTFLAQEVARTLAKDPGTLDEAVACSERAVRISQGSPSHPTALATLAHLLIARSDADLDSGRVALEQSVVEGYPDSAWALYRVGRARQKQGDLAGAIQAYLRAASVFPTPYPKADSTLRSAFQSWKGSLDGLDRTLAEARSASRHQVIFEGPRFERAAPLWTVPALDRGLASLEDHRGRVVVLDFWGTWCPPCVEAMPKLQQVYDAFRGRGVSFVAADVDPMPDLARQRRHVRQFVRDRKFTVPVVLADSAMVENYGVNLFPTTFVLDRSGQIRFRNTGGGPVFDEILREQIEVLLAEDTKRQP